MDLPRLLAADPPWLFNDRLPGDGRGASKKYRCLSTSEIEAFPIPPMAPDSVLLLWKVGALQEDAFRVARAWGYVPTAEGVWNKTRACPACRGSGQRPEGGPCFRCWGSGDVPWMGMGRHVRYAHEAFIIAVRGRPARLRADVLSTFSARVPLVGGRAVHSAKPDLFYRIAEALYPGPRVELFARRRRPGWECLGDELPEVLP